MPNYTLDQYEAVGGPLARATQTQTQQPVMTTGGNQPPAVAPTAPSMSTPLPPQTVTTTTAPPMSDPLPPQQANLQNILNQLGAINGQNFVATTQAGNGGPGTAPIDIVQQMMNTLLGSDSRYIQDARLRGQEMANERGLLNSSIAAGAAEREAIQAAQPLLNQAVGLHGQREQLTFQGQQNQLDRVQTVNNQLLASQLAERQAVFDAQLRQQLQSDSAAQQDWLNSRSFTRQFNASLSMVPVQGAMDLTRMVQQYALNDPEVYTPQVISGMTNFLTQNMFSIFSTYFPNMVRTTTGTGG